MTASGAASLGLAGFRVRISSKVCTMCIASCPPAPPADFTQRRNSRKAGADHQSRWAGAWGGEGSELEVLERRWRRLGGEVPYGWRGEWCAWGEEDVDMGRRWRAWWRPGERQRRLRGLWVEDAYGRYGEREGRWCSCGGGNVDMERRQRARRRLGEREQRLRRLGVEDAYRRRGERDAPCCS